MKRKILFITPGLFAFIFAFTACGQKVMTLEERLATLPATSVRRIEGDTSFKEVYEIRIIQPVDHNNPGGPTFTQQLFLGYEGTDKPVVVETEGYSARNGKTELARLLKCNQIRIEHRYFEDSCPDSLNWSYLTTWQAAADHHRIIELFKPVFRGKWITTGISKGGSTVIYHSYYYPNDVDVRVPYVGPLSFGPEDERFKPFFDSVGSNECRDKVFQFQKLALEHEKSLMPALSELAGRKGWTFERVGGQGKAFEMTVLEYEFSFWQWGKLPCDSIPLNGSDEKIFKHLAAISDFSYFSDQGVKEFEPFFYQAMTELGYYGYDTEKFTGLLNYVTDTSDPDFLFAAPQGIDYTFNYQLDREVARYLRDDADHFLFIYGGYDPWSAAAADPGVNDQCVRIFNKGGSHLTRIGNLPPDQRDQVLSVLGKWLGSEIVLKQ